MHEFNIQNLSNRCRHKCDPSFSQIFWISFLAGFCYVSGQTVRTKQPPRSARTRARAHTSLTNFSVLPFGLKSERKKKAMEEASKAMRAAVVLWQRSPITQCENPSNCFSCSNIFLKFMIQDSFLGRQSNVHFGKSDKNLIKV